MKKKLLLLLLTALVAFGLYTISDQTDILSNVQAYVNNGDIKTLEASFTADAIMTNNQKKLLGNGGRQYLTPSLKYQPYLLMDVKYTQDKKSKEGVILWSLMDGEMVLNGDTWEKTHGFEDAINAKATKEEFRILNAIAKNGGSISKDTLLVNLQEDADELSPTINSLINKHLITRKANYLQLHFENPKIAVVPQTKFSRHLVSKEYNHSQLLKSKYSTSQIEKGAKSAFGSDFTIRSSTVVYLPIYQILVENPDSSTSTTYWNAITGEMLKAL